MTEAGKKRNIESDEETGETITSMLIHQHILIYIVKLYIKNKYFLEYHCIIKSCSGNASVARYSQIKEESRGISVRARASL